MKSMLITGTFLPMVGLLVVEKIIIIRVPSAWMVDHESPGCMHLRIDQAILGTRGLTATIPTAYRPITTGEDHLEPFLAPR